MIGTISLLANIALTVPYEYWSEVRSRGRAARRRARGHTQRIKYEQRPDPKLYRIGEVIVGHPATLAALTASVPHRS